MLRLLLLAALSMAAAFAPSIEGSVVSATSGSGIGGVQVELMQGAAVVQSVQTATSDGRGAFQFTGVNDGTYWVRCTADGYAEEYATPFGDCGQSSYFAVTGGVTASKVVGRMVPLYAERPGGGSARATSHEGVMRELSSAGAFEVKSLPAGA